MKSKISPSALPKADSRASFVIGCGILLTTAATYLIVLQLSSQKAVSLANASSTDIGAEPEWAAASPAAWLWALLEAFVGSEDGCGDTEASGRGP